MKLFITVATGFVGSALFKELMDAGHEVMGLARSDASANALLSEGAKVLRGDLQDLDSLKSGADAADGVIAGSRYHAAGDEAITLKTISEMIGKKLGIAVVSIAPEQAQDHFGWFAGFAAVDCPASSKITQRNLHWSPTHPSLIDDLAGDVYIP